MLSQRKTLRLQNYHLFLLIGINSFGFLVIGLLSSRLGPFLGFILGPITFSLTFGVSTNSIFWRELRPFLVIIASSFLGTAFLWVSCKFMQCMVCQHYAFEAQLFTNFAFPLIVPVILWPFSRLPELRKRNFKP
jgi:hypothetical protein